MKELGFSWIRASWLCLMTVLGCGVSPLGAQDFRVTDLTLEEDGSLTIRHTANEDSYYLLVRGTDPGAIMDPAMPGGGWLANAKADLVPTVIGQPTRGPSEEGGVQNR